MMRLILAFAVVLLAGSLTGQVKHAPTVAQCQADQRLWSSQLEGDAKNSLKVDNLTDMSGEMESCYKVDPPNAKKYQDTEVEDVVIQATRMRRFIQRHQLWDKFLEEDAAGKR
jgi:hypothetical protein